MALTVGINGFGRIGRYLLRLLVKDKNIKVGAINARASNESLAYLFKYDSTHGTYEGQVGHDANGLIIDGTLIPVTRHKAGEWEWKKLGVSLVVETSGSLKTREALSQHLTAGAQKVIISAPCNDADITIVYGVNDDTYDSEKHTVISAASCTTNCLAPAAKVLHESFGIKHGLVNTIHSYTMSQRILDGSHKDIRRGRAASMSMIPTSTGAAKALALVLPELTNKLGGMAVRVPTPNVSLVDVTCEVEKACTVQMVNDAFRAASDGVLKHTLGYCEEPLVSVDFSGSTYGGVVDSLCTMVSEENLIKAIVWYDNEAGFTHQLVRLMHLVGKK